jgi:hypothetical protein
MVEKNKLMINNALRLETPRLETPRLETLPLETSVRQQVSFNE